MIFLCVFLQLVNGLPQSLRNDISREFKDIIGEDVSSHLDKLKSEVHLIEDDIKQAVTEMGKFRLIRGLN